MPADSTDDRNYWNYRVYGLQLRTNLPIPGLLGLHRSGKPDVVITFETVKFHQSQPAAAVPCYTSPGTAENGEPFFKVWKCEDHPHEHLGIQYTDGKGLASFLINREGSQARITRTESTLLKDVVTYFFGPVIGCILRLRGVTCLHAGVVSFDGRALAIVGPKGAGKSTVVAALAHHGHAVLSDDIAPLSEIEDSFVVAPGYPRLRLWPSTVEEMPGISAEAAPKILSISEKRFINLAAGKKADGWKFQPEPMPLAAVYVLNRRPQHGGLSIISQSKAEGLLLLSGNVYPHYSLHSTDRARDFAVLGRLATSVPVRQTTQPEDLGALDELCDAILDDFKSLI